METRHKKYLSLVLKEEIATRRGEYTLLISRASPSAVQERVTAICHAIDADLLADMYYVPDAQSIKIGKVTEDASPYFVNPLPDCPMPKDANSGPMEGITATQAAAPAPALG